MKSPTFNNVTTEINFYNQKDNRFDYLDNIKLKSFEKILYPCKLEKINSQLNYLNTFVREISKEANETNLIYKKSGSTGHLFRLKVKDKLSFAVKVTAYPKCKNYNKYNIITRPENADIKMLNILSEFVKKNQTPHIVLPLTYFLTNTETFVQKTMDIKVIPKKYSEFIDKFNNNIFESKSVVTIVEWINGGDMLDFIRKYHKKLSILDWKVMIFQILFTLAIIQEKYPAFRHNDLKLNNILINIDPTKRNADIWKQYTFKKYEFIIPDIGIDTMLTDFDFSCIQGVVENEKVDQTWTDKINVSNHSHKYYDIFFLFGSMCKFLKHEMIPTEIKQFVYRVIPNKFCKKGICTPKYRLLTNEVYTTPKKIILSDPLFKEFQLYKA